MNDAGTNDVVLALILLGLGVVLVFWGGAALRALIALAGAVVGFFLGAELVQGQAGGELLGTTWGWVAAIVGALVLGVLAYAWYWLGVVIWVGAMGYVLGVFLANAFGADKDWVFTTVGIIVAAVLVIIAVVASLPALLLVIVSAWSGATLALTGVMLLVGEINDQQIDHAFSLADPSWLWYGALVVLFVVGLVVQLGATSRRSAQSVGG
ncbi:MULTISPECIES: DUF4203 domain-containing protein [Mumia]|uniref:TM7S3/TM198-like domain-containing protein n=1 Tax=Mumia TaxID=1546255 RepID=UPI00142279FD|nr:MULTISPECIES: DUF4203 domain-containing protein [unclassified Mumia]QMW66926.1 DUF4203 domain-containing protein [Mumia sp. ZJ1417]